MKRAIILLTIAAACKIPPAVASSDDPPTKDDWQCRIAILSDDLSCLDGQLVRSLVNRLEEEGFDMSELAAAQVCDNSELTADRFFLYIIPNCRTYPASGLKTLATYAGNGGHVLFLGGPFLDDPIWRSKDGWLNKEAVLAIKQKAEPTHAPFPREALNTAGWIRTCNDRTVPGTWEVVPEGPHGEPCFHFTTKNLTGWDGYLSPALPRLFGPRHNLFTFMAKGSTHTSQVAIEIQEQDGSRSIDDLVVAYQESCPNW